MPAGPFFQLVSGVSGAEEYCLQAPPAGGPVGMVPCLEAVAAADGRDIWSLAGAGLKNLSSDTCLLKDLTLGDCSRAVPLGFKDHHLEANGECIRAKAETVLGSRTTPESKGKLLVDLGGVYPLKGAEVHWKIPPAGYKISTSKDGQHWEQAFATDVNTDRDNHVRLAGEAQYVRAECTATHPFYANRPCVGKMTLSSAKLALESGACDRSPAAKWFLTSEEEFDPAPVLRLRHAA